MAPPEEAELESEEDDYEDEEDVGTIYQVSHEFKREKEGDLEIKVGDLLSIIDRNDDGWWKAENEAGAVGMVPSTFLAVYEEEEEEESEVVVRTKTAGEEEENTSAKDCWNEIREGVHSPPNVTDVLTALGSIPSGFRPSTLGGMLAKDVRSSTKAAVLPTLTDSKIAFQDLHWDVVTNQIRMQITKVLRKCTIQNCTMVPPLGGATEVLSRQIRVCLFDGTNMVSNIHTIRCTVGAANIKLWKFARRARNVATPILDDPTFMLRSNATHANLSLLFELGVKYKRTQTNEQAELSCGWTVLKLSDAQGKPIPNKTYKLKLHGGTPYDQGLDVDASILRRAPTNRFQALLAANREPKISFILSTPAVAKRKFLNLLPETIILPSCICYITSIYREILADNLLRDRLSHRDAELIPSAVLAAFPDAVQFPDLLDGFMMVWNERTKILKAADKRDHENMKNMFTKCFMETVFPLLHSQAMPDPKLGNLQVETLRRQKIFEHVTRYKPTSALVEDPNFVLKSLLAANVDHKPFDVDEVCFDLQQAHLLQ